MVPFFALLIIYHINVAVIKYLYKNELESTFIEIVNPRKSSIIVGVIYRHPSTDLDCNYLIDFNCNYLNKLLEKTSKEQKSISLLGDFNVNLLNL